MKDIFFVIGASGVGKTTVMNQLKTLLGTGYKIHDFDERGVPDNVDTQWRIDETQHWMDTARQNSQNSTKTIICGLARPSEFTTPESVGFIYLHANKNTLRARLAKRNTAHGMLGEMERVSVKPPEQFIEDNLNFAEHLYDEAKQYGVEIIDTSELRADEVSRRVVELIKEK